GSWDTYGVGSTYTSCSIVSAIVLQIRHGTRCCSKLHLDGVGSFARATSTIPGASVARALLVQRNCLKTRSEIFLPGIGLGVQGLRIVHKKTIRCWPSTVRGSISGRTSMLTIMLSACAKDGNEPNLLGHKPLHLFSGGKRRTISSYQTPPPKHAAPGGSINYFRAYVGRNPGKTLGARRRRTVPIVRRGNKQSSIAALIRCQGGMEIRGPSLRPLVASFRCAAARLCCERRRRPVCNE